MKRIETLIGQFIFHCQYEKSLSKNTLKCYTIDLAQFLDFIKEYQQTEEIDKNTIKAFVKNRLENFKVKSAKRKIACVKAFFNFLEYEEIITVSPFRKIRLQIKEPIVLPKVLTMNEMESIIRSTYLNYESIEDKAKYKYKEAIRDATIIELLFSTGIRVSELCGLKLHNVEISSGNIKVTGKGNKERVIQICNDEANILLKKYYSLYIIEINKCNGFFINRFGNPLSTQSVRGIVKKFAGKAAMKKKVTPHTFRHSFATLLLEEGVDIKYIQKLLGHSSIMTTQIYTHVSQSKQIELLTTKHPRHKMTVRAGS